MHPAVMKAKRIARIAVENGWQGNIQHDKGATLLTAERNDESIIVGWQDNVMINAAHYILGKETQLHCAKQVLEYVEGWPDVLKLFRWFPNMNRPTLVEKYRRLPFDWENDDDDTIISNLIGRQIFWYSHISMKMYCDVVLEPKGKKSNKFEIKHVGHRKMFNFIGAQAGFRSVLLDALVKVG